MAAKQPGANGILAGPQVLDYRSRRQQADIHLDSNIVEPPLAVEIVPGDRKQARVELPHIPETDQRLGGRQKSSVVTHVPDLSCISLVDDLERNLRSFS